MNEFLSLTVPFWVPVVMILFMAVGWAVQGGRSWSAGYAKGLFDESLEQARTLEDAFEEGYAKGWQAHVRGVEHRRPPPPFHGDPTIVMQRPLPRRQ